MFLDMGLKSVRMDDIATGLGVSKRTLYEMFGDKKALLDECMSFYFDSREQIIRKRTEGAANVMEEIFIMLDNMNRDEKEAAFMDNLKKFYPDIFNKWMVKAHRNSYKKLDQLFDRGISQGLLLADMNKELALVTLVYTMSSLFEKRYHFPILDKTPPKEAFRYVLVNFFRGLSTRRGIELIDELTVNYRKTR